MPDSATQELLTVDFEPVGRRIEIQPGRNLLEAAQGAGVSLASVCGGQGSCNSCRVRLMSGELSPPTARERGVFEPQDLEAGNRLACQTIPRTSVKIDIPTGSLASTQRLQIEGGDVNVSGRSIVAACDLQLKAASLEDLRSDTDRLRTALAEAGHAAIDVSPQVLLTISDALRDNHWHVRAALRGRRVVALLPMETKLLGLAVDIGTTKLASYLLDLETGRTLAKTGAMNPQISYGEDVISRIAYCDTHGDGRTVLQSKLVDALNEMVGTLCDATSADRSQIVEAVFVGNTAMHHLLAGLPVHQLAMAPYVSAINESLDLRAADLGLSIADGALVHLPPNIAGFVGSDHVAVVLSTDICRSEQTVIVLDIGTNTEITLAHKNRLFCCSCASGPAFEGAHIQDGIRALPGAIERVQIVDGEPMVLTIGEQAPIGICGSGILDAIAELIRHGVLDRRGAMKADHPRVRPSEQKNYREYVLVAAGESGHGRDLVVTRSDVNEIQLAKAAIRAGLEVLIGEAGISADELGEVIVAGAFGTYLDIDSAVAVGMFPDLPRNRFRQMGNAAGTGARQMLVSADYRALGEQIRRRVEYIELTTHGDFKNAFIKALNFRVPGD